MGFSAFKIQNFQNHSRSILRFSPGVNVIVGSTDSGKSSIYRALRWLVCNVPGGSSFIRFEEQLAQCSALFDGVKVVRRRGRDGSVNFYKVQEKELTGFGRGVPGPVQEVFQFSDLNFQGQFDPPFLITETPGKIGKRLNDVADFSKADSALDKAKKEKRELSSRLRYDQDELDKVQRELEALGPVEELDRVLSEVEEVYAKRQLKGKEFLRHAATMQTVVDNKKRMHVLRERSGVLKKLADVEKELAEVGKKKKQTQASISNLRRAVEERKNRQALVQFTKQAAHCERELVRVGEECDLIQEAKVWRRKWLKARALQTRLKEEAGGICPLCGGKLP